jgi:hypothetical protein
MPANDYWYTNFDGLVCNGHIQPVVCNGNNKQQVAVAEMATEASFVKSVTVNPRGVRPTDRSYGMDDAVGRG